MVKLDELPVEILMRILSYLRRYKQVYLVNKFFYDVACSVNDSQNCVCLRDIFLKGERSEGMMKSIQNTRRKISKLDIDFYQGVSRSRFYALRGSEIRESAIADVLNIVKKFSTNIKFLRLANVSLTMSAFLEVLSLLPNVESLILFYVCKVRDEQHGQFENVDELLPLQQLKTLTIESCSVDIPVVFNRLPTGVLKELILSDRSTIKLKLLKGLFMRQSNITKLQLAFEQFTQQLDATTSDNSERSYVNHMFDHLQLEEVEFECHQSEYDRGHANFLAKQPALRVLILRQGEIDNHVFGVITDRLRELETLHINVDETLAVPFKNIVKLKKLRNLTLESFNLEILQEFAELDNSNISILIFGRFTLPLTDEYILLAVNVVGKLATSAPNLKELRFQQYCTIPMIDAIMKKFNFLEVLEMRVGRLGAKDLNAILDDDHCRNPKLTELTIHGIPFEVSVLKKLNRNYPNLEKVSFYVLTPIILSTFKVLLNEFGKMKSLTLETSSISTAEECLDYLREHKNNLKSVTLSCDPEINSRFEKRKERLHDAFNKIDYDDWDGILYMTDRIL